MKTKILYLTTLTVIFIAGCGGQQVSNIDMRNDEGNPVMALDYRDFEQAASELVQSLLGSGALRKDDGGRYVVATGNIVNDTMQRIDTDQLMAKIEIEMLNSNQAVMSSAVGPQTDELLMDTRNLRDSDEFDTTTTAAKRTLIAPELTIAGKILQRNIQYNRSTQQVEYYFQLQLNDVTTGLRFWQDEVVVGKRGSNRSVSW